MVIGARVRLARPNTISLDLDMGVNQTCRRIHHRRCTPQIAPRPSAGLDYGPDSRVPLASCRYHSHSKISRVVSFDRPEKRRDFVSGGRCVVAHRDSSE